MSNIIVLPFPGLTPSSVTPTELAAASVVEAKLDTVTNNTLNAARVGKWTYDFTVLGGAVSTIALTGAALAAKAVIFGGFIRVLTALTSGGAATAALQVEAANDIVNATVVSGAPWSTTGRKVIIPTWAITNSVETTLARTPSIVIGTFALTAGKFDLWLFYEVTD